MQNPSMLFFMLFNMTKAKNTRGLYCAAQSGALMEELLLIYSDDGDVCSFIITHGCIKHSLCFRCLWPMQHKKDASLKD